MRGKIRSCMAGVPLAVVLLATLAQAGTLSVPGDFGTIQAAVDAAAPGTTILIGPGVFEEQVIVSTDDLTLRGSGSGSNPAVDTILRSPVTLTTSFSTGSNDNYPVLGIVGATGCSIEDIRVDGFGRGNGNYRMLGIGFYNGDGTVDGCAVTAIRETPFNGNQHGVCIYAFHDVPPAGGSYDVDVLNTDVDDYQKNGMAFFGSDMVVNVDNCTATGIGPTSITAQNGIQMSLGASGTIRDCTVVDHYYTPATFASTGILLFGGTGVDVIDCTVTDNFPGLYAQDTDGSASGLQVQNTATVPQTTCYLFEAGASFTGEEGEGERGGPPVLPSPFEMPYEATQRGAGIMTFDVSGSEFIGTDAPGTSGIGVFATAGTLMTDLSENTVRDFDTGVAAIEGSGTILMSAGSNSIFGNATEALFSDTATPVDAENNWWGDASGPFDPTGTIEVPPCAAPADALNADGLGDMVSDNIDYCPFLESPAELSLTPDDDCLQFGDTVVISIDMANVGSTTIVGGQFFLAYDTTKLTFVSADAGDAPFTNELFEFVDAVGGTIDYAVGIPLGGSGASADTTMARLTFDVVSSEICAASGLVSFRASSPPTRITDSVGTSLTPDTDDLGALTIDDTAPSITCPGDLVANADAGFCNAMLTVGSATATDNCDASPDITGTRSDALALGDPYPAGVTTITWEAVDDCGNLSSCVQTVTVDALNSLSVNVALSPAVQAAPFTRCITFELFETGCGASTIVEEVLTFTSGAASVTIDVPCGSYECITARDRLHTLRSTDADGFMISGTEFVADFTVGDELVGGNLNDDPFVDILDFGVFAGQFNTNFGTGDTDCTTPFPHADIDGDGLVNSLDFTFILVNFLSGAQADCCGLAPATSEGPIERISVDELRARGLTPHVAGDLNHDGWLDVEDMRAFLRGSRPSAAHRRF